MKLYNSLPESNRNILGNISIQNNVVKWEIPTSDGFASVLFEKQMLMIIANIFYKIFNIGTTINNNEIYLDSPDDEGVIIKPYSLVAISKILSINHNSCYGEIFINQCKFIKNWMDSNPNFSEIFVDSCKNEFYSVLLNLRKRELEL